MNLKIKTHGQITLKLRLYDLLTGIKNRAEFAERSVDKLEATIDGLLDALMNEKLAYRFLKFETLV